MRRIALINQKGGVGKTTSTANLGACLATLGRRVVILDIDPQANLTVHFGVSPYEIEASIYDLLMGERAFDEVLVTTEVDGLELIPANIDLAGAEIELVGMIGREIILKEKLEGLEDRYDYLLIDCPPSLGLLTLNALTTVDEIFIPLQVEFFALQGMSQLLKTLERVKKRLNHDLDITGIIPCMYDARTRLSREVLANIRQYFEAKVFNTIVRKNVKLAESPSYGAPIINYEPSATGATDYMALAREVIDQETPKPAPGPAEDAATGDTSPPVPDQTPPAPETTQDAEPAGPANVAEDPPAGDAPPAPPET